MNITASSWYAGLLWLLGLGFHGINVLLKGSEEKEGALDFLDPFHHEFFSANVPDPARPAVILVGPREGETLALAVNDRVQVKKTDSDFPLQFFTDRYKVTAVPGSGMVKLDLGDNSLPVTGSERTMQTSRINVELFRDIEVLDVTVTLGGRKVAEDEEIAVNPMQRAALQVEPGGHRKYDVTLLKPQTGDIRLITADTSLKAENTSRSKSRGFTTTSPRQIRWRRRPRAWIARSSRPPYPGAAVQG
jgi:hypothetical protein